MAHISQKLWFGFGSFSIFKPLWHLPSFFFSDIQHYAFNISDFAIVDYSITKLFYPNDFTSFI
jgi:hypothetical protein